jgi:AraC-like DNA-binding protein/mannose-6-phosphate isomerase-like protein (cupin superfamily)
MKKIKQHVSQRLTSGRFYGKTLRERKVGDLVLADVVYSPGSRLPRHVHERPYFCLIRKGTYTEAYGRRTRVCDPGALVFHPPGESHTEAFGNCPVASFNVEIGPKWLYRLRQVGGVLDQPVEFHGGEAATLGFRLLSEFRRSDTDSFVAIESLTSEILAAVVGLPVEARDQKPKWLTKARDLLDVRIQEPGTLRFIAREAGVHPVYFATTFRRFYGCSVGEYLRRRRLERVCRMLTESELPLAEIALDAGFADQSHFTRAVKRFTSMTPAQYRTFLRFKTPQPLSR